MAPRFSRTAAARVARASPCRSTRSSIAVSDFSFGKERRIRRRSDFLRVQAVGERATSRHFVLLVAAREDGPAALARVGFVATKKVGDATMRNRIKRVCRECFRLWPAPGFVPGGIDLVVIARNGADALPLAMVREEWTQARGALLKRCAKVLAAAGAASPEASSSGP